MGEVEVELIPGDLRPGCPHALTQGCVCTEQPSDLVRVQYGDPLLFTIRADCPMHKKRIARQVEAG